MSWISKINSLPQREKEELYKVLLPSDLLRRFSIRRETFLNPAGQKVVRISARESERTAVIEVKRRLEDRDAVFEVQVSDSPDLVAINWDFIIINDVEGERFQIDADKEGKDTLFGCGSRNLKEEERALKHGLAPGQIYRGLRITGPFMRCLEEFCEMLGIKSVHLEALFYHNALLYENYGFTYLEGFKRMTRIHQLFQEGRPLFKRLDGSTPFRQPGFEKSIRGRSWAIHDEICNDLDDCILHEPWFSPKMYRMMGNPSKICTFPGATY